MGHLAKLGRYIFPEFFSKKMLIISFYERVTSINGDGEINLKFLFLKLPYLNGQNRKFDNNFKKNKKSKDYKIKFNKKLIYILKIDNFIIKILLLIF